MKKKENALINKKSLIKHNNLRQELYKLGIARINKKTIDYLEKSLEKKIDKIIRILAKELMIKGKKP